MEPCIVYAFTYIYLKEKQKALFELGMNDSGKVFINGKKYIQNSQGKDAI